MDIPAVADQLSRRHFLRLSALVAGGAAVGVAAACSPSAPTASPTPAGAPTAAKVATAASQAAPVAKAPGKLSAWLQKYYVDDANAVIAQAFKTAGQRGNFEIDLQWLPWDDAAYSKWAAATEAKQLPDIGMPPGYPSQYQAMGRLVDVSDLFAEIGKSGGGWYDYVAKDSTINGKQYWIPTFNEVALGHYRIDLFEQAGYKLPLKSLDDLLEAAKAITKPPDSIWGIGVGMTHGDWNHHLLPVMWAFGARYQDEQGKITVDTPEMVEAVTWYTDLYTKHKVTPPGVTSWDPSSNNKAYLAGQVAFVSNPGSILGAMRKGDGQPGLLEKTFFGPVPGRNNGPWESANFAPLFITTDSKTQEQARSAIKTLLSEEFYPKFLEASASNFFTVLQGFADIPFFKNDKYNQQIIKEVLPYAKPRAWAGVGTPTFSEVDSTLLWGQMLQRVTVDKWEPKKAVDEFAQKVRDIDAKYKKG